MEEGYVYVTGTGRPGDPVKIGWSVSPGRRIQELQTGSPNQLLMLATHSGPPELEKFLHDQFASQRSHGEWFSLESPVAQVAEAVQAWRGRPSGAQRRAGAVSSESVLAMLDKESGITGDDFRVFWYCGIRAGDGRTVDAKEVAEFLGLSVPAVRRIMRKLAEGGFLVVDDVVGRTIKYRASPHIVPAPTGAGRGKPEVPAAGACRPVRQAPRRLPGPSAADARSAPTRA